MDTSSIPSKTNVEDDKEINTESDESRALQDLCDVNGITKEMCSTVESLDMFMGAVKDLTSTRHFPNLTSLCIMKQLHLKEIIGLDKCPKLNSLWLTECPLERVSGLERCISLKSLYLSGNHFSKIGGGLSTLTNLTTLWVNENKLTELKGLEVLVSLKVLWACGNSIDIIGDIFQYNTQLEEINLSSNQISSLRDVLHLSLLPKLKKLSFRDPHFGANPLCHLCNYQTYMIHHLPNLTILDAESIGEESKQLVKAIYTKKKMYYNMRCKTLKRDASNVVSKAEELLRIASLPMHAKAKLFARAIKDIGAVSSHLSLQEQNNSNNNSSSSSSSSSSSGNGNDSPTGILIGNLTSSTTDQQTSSIQVNTNFETDNDDKSSSSLPLMKECSQLLLDVQNAHNEVNTCMSHMSNEVQDLVKNVINEVSELSTSRVMLEFDTGGNVRLEEGKPSDSWHQNCCDLVRSRFTASDYHKSTSSNSSNSSSSSNGNNILDVSSIHVTRVVRVHNRYLRWRFDKVVKKSQTAQEALLHPTSETNGGGTSNNNTPGGTPAGTPTRRGGAPSLTSNNNGSAAIKALNGDSSAKESSSSGGSGGSKDGQKTSNSKSMEGSAGSNTTSNTTTSKKEGVSSDKDVGIKPPAMEYLFFGDESSDRTDRCDRERVLRVAEEGFLRVDHRNNKPIPLSSYIYGADESRFNSFMMTNNNNNNDARNDHDDGQNEAHQNDGHGEVPISPCGKGKYYSGNRGGGKVRNYQSSPSSKSPSSTSTSRKSPSPSSSSKTNKMNRNSPHHINNNNPISSLRYLIAHEGRKRYRGQFLVVKALVDDAVELSEINPASSSSSSDVKLTEEDNLLLKNHSCGYKQIKNTKKRKWYFNDNNALLPEYIICFEYSLKDEKSLFPIPSLLQEESISLGIFNGLNAFNSDSDFTDRAPFLSPLLFLYHRLNNYANSIIQVPLSRASTSTSTSPSKSPKSSSSSKSAAATTNFSFGGLKPSHTLSNVATEVEIVNRIEKFLKTVPSPTLNNGGGGGGGVVGGGNGGGSPKHAQQSSLEIPTDLIISGDGNISSNSSSSGSSSMGNGNSSHGSVKLRHLLKYANVLEVSQLTYLNLHGQGISNSSSLIACTHLKKLILSSNFLDGSNLLGLMKIKTLLFLDLSFNVIVAIPSTSSSSSQENESTSQLNRSSSNSSNVGGSGVGFGKSFDFFASLEELDLSFNAIENVNHLFGLKQICPNISSLDTRGNVLLIEGNRHRESILTLLPSIHILDGSKVKPSELGAGRTRDSTALSVDHLVAAATEGGVKLFEPSLRPLNANKGWSDHTGRNSSTSEPSEIGIDMVHDGMDDMVPSSTQTLTHREQSSSSIHTSSTSSHNNNGGSSSNSHSNSNGSRIGGGGLVASASSLKKMKGRGWLGTVDQLIVDNAYLCSLRPLILDLNALRVVSFRNNRLPNSSLADLGTYCPNLEEISLENNQLDNLSELWRELNEKNNILSMDMNHGDGGGNGNHSNGVDGVSNMNNIQQRNEGWFRHLKKFDCSHNNLTSLDDLQLKRPLSAIENNQHHKNKHQGQGGHVQVMVSLERLTQLSLESNHIKHLGPLRSLLNLMELYMGNNDIAELAEIDHLKPLTKLIILDLAGSPICALTDYRPCVLFRLKRLKVLDGVGVAADEVQAANERFSGRLTVEIVLEAILSSHADPNFSSTTLLNCCGVLDLSSLKLRDVSCIPNAGLNSLHELNLDNNSLASFSLLLTLPSLVVLRLNHNKITCCSNDGSNTNQSRPQSAPSSGYSNNGGSSNNGNSGGGNGMIVGKRNLAVSPLEVLLLGFNRIASIEELELERFPNLRVLHLQSNQLTTLQGLSICTSLRELVLNKNRIRKLDAASVQGLSVIHELHLQENGLRYLDFISDLTSLQSLHLGYNRISDIVELEKLSHLDHLVNIALNNNPVSRRQLYRFTLLVQLQTVRWIDGREATWEERERAELILSKGERNPSLLYAQRIGNILPGNNGVTGGISGGNAFTVRSQPGSHVVKLPGQPVQLSALQGASFHPTFHTFVGPGGQQQLQSQQQQQHQQQQQQHHQQQQQQQQHHHPPHYSGVGGLVGRRPDHSHARRPDQNRSQLSHKHKKLPLCASKLSILVVEFLFR